MRMRMAMTAAVATLAVGGFGAPAVASEVRPAAPSADVVSVSRVYLDDGRPMVAGTYRCTGRLTHLWVSVKQGGRNLDQEGSGAKARSWYQRSWDNKRVRCDGREHTEVYRLRPTGGDTGRLRAGRRAYVQFCLLTANRPSGFGEGGNSSFASNMRYRRVTAL